MDDFLGRMSRFRGQILPAQQALYQRLAADGQSPKALMISCADSRVVPELITQADPGELFVCRNAGNIVPPFSQANGGVSSAVEYAVVALGVRDIIVCGHSDCGAMKALVTGSEGNSGPLADWLRAAGNSLSELERRPELAPQRSRQDRLSQAHALVQLEHLRSHACVREAEAAGRLRLHAWWFDLAGADVHAWEPDLGGFTLIDEAEAEKILSRLGA